MNPLDRAVLGGMLVSTVLMLVLVPCVYALVHRRAGSGSNEVVAA
jgi:multidrug efflux pump subunit AcrB